MGDKYIDEFDNIDDNLKGSSLFLMYSDCDTVNASLSAITAYINALSPDISITGGTYDQNTGVATFTNNSGGTFTVSGFLTGYTDTIISAFTYNDANRFTINSTNGSSFSADINILTGLTINGDLNVTGTTNLSSINVNTISATTYQNLPLDKYVTGGTYSNGTATFRNNNGGTFNVTGFSTATNFTGGTVTGPTKFTGGLKANTFSATTYQNLPLDKYVTGGTYSNGTATFRNNNGGTFNVTGFVTAFTGNTSASCITELWVSNLHGCSPITIHNSIKHNSSIVSNNTSFAFGDSVIATGSSSHAEGYLTTASNTASHAEGVKTRASGLYSHAEGSGTTASNTASHAEGRGTTAKGTYSHAEGQNTIASGSSSHTEGYLTTAKGSGSHAEGQYTTAIGDSSHAEGETTTAIGDQSHAEGFGSTARGGASHAEGANATAYGPRSHAEGYQTTAIGYGSHSEGMNTIASGISSHSEGYFTIAKGNYSHAEGYFTSAKGTYSHAGGDTTIATGLGSFIHSSGSTVSGIRSVVLGGKNITGATNDTVYVPNLNINTTPANDNTLNNVLVRASDGAVKYRTISTSTTYGLFAQTGNSTPIISNAEGTLIDGGVGTLSVPANGFSVGDSFKADFGGLMSCKNNETLTIRIKAGSTVLSLSPNFQMPGINNQVWLLSINFTIRAIGPAGTASIVVLANLHVLKQASGVQEGFGWNTINITTFDTTISNTLNVTAQWGSNTPAQNSIYSDIFVLNKIY